MSQKELGEYGTYYDITKRTEEMQSAIKIYKIKNGTVFSTPPTIEEKSAERFGIRPEKSPKVTESNEQKNSESGIIPFDRLLPKNVPVALKISVPGPAIQ